MEHLDKEGILPNYAATTISVSWKLNLIMKVRYTLKTAYEEVEINNRGRVIRQLHTKPLQAGKDITLTLDLSLQKYIEKLLASSRDAVMVINPRDDCIRVVESNPSQEQNLFVEGISSKNYHKLLEDDNHPLINRASQGVYPLTSTVKPYIAVSAFTLAVINKNFSLFDLGQWQLPVQKNATATENARYTGV